MIPQNNNNKNWQNQIFSHLGKFYSEITNSLEASVKWVIEARDGPTRFERKFIGQPVLPKFRSFSSIRSYLIECGKWLTVSQLTASLIFIFQSSKTPTSWAFPISYLKKLIILTVFVHSQDSLRHGDTHLRNKSCSF